MDRRQRIGLALAAGSGILYGAINVLAKPVDLHPLVKGAVAYLASALALGWWMRGLRIDGRDWPKVLVMGLVGGGLAPVLLFYGLRETAAADAGLLLTVEMVATGALAMLFLGERYHGREFLGFAALLLSAAFVAMASGADGGAGGSSLRGVLLVLGSAVGWGFDNAVSAHLVGNYEPRGLIALKGVLGGTASLIAALVVQAPPPTLAPAAAMVGLGVASVGMSSILFYTALRRVGAARTSAMNIALTALIGAFGGWLLLHEHLHLLHAGALLAVLVGAYLLATTKRPDGQPPPAQVQPPVQSHP